LPSERDAGSKGGDGRGEAGQREVLEDARTDVRAPDRAIRGEVRGVGQGGGAQSPAVEEGGGAAGERRVDREGQRLRPAGRGRGNSVVLRQRQVHLRRDAVRDLQGG